MAFGHIHVAGLTQGTPAHNALHCQVGLASGRSLGGTGDVVLVVLALAGQTSSATTLDLFLLSANSGDRQTDRQTERPFYGVMVELHDGLSSVSWLRDDDGNECILQLALYIFVYLSKAALLFSLPTVGRLTSSYRLMRNKSLISRS